MADEKMKKAFLHVPNLTEQKGIVIKKAFEEVASKGLTDVKGYFDNNTLEMQGKDNTGATVVLSREFVGTGENFNGSRYPRHHSQQELEYNCSELYAAGYKQVQIAKKLGISQSRVSQILHKK